MSEWDTQGTGEDAAGSETAAAPPKSSFWGAATDFVSSFLPAPVRAAVENSATSLQSGLETIAGAVSEVGGVAKGAWDFNTSDGMEMAAENQKAILEATADIPNQDIIYEQLAHNLAYGRYDPGQIKEWGYAPPQVVIPLDPKTGMYVVAVVPDPTLSPEAKATMEEMHGKPLRPVLAFRGSTDAVDWADDVSPEGIGAFHFAMHKAEVANALAKYKGPDVTGHSLGGALAELAATAGPVGRVVTFQSPGIPPELAAQVPDTVEATHHRAAEDVVAWAGGEHLAGDSFIYDQNGSMPGLSHTDFLLADLNRVRNDDYTQPGGVVPGIYDASVFDGEPDYEMEGTSPLNQGLVDDYNQNKMELTWVSQNAPDWDMDNQTDWYEQLYNDKREDLAETVRSGVGSTLRFGDDLLGGLDQMATDELDCPSSGVLSPVTDAMAWMWQTGRETIYDGDATSLVANAAQGAMTPLGDQMNVSADDMKVVVTTWQAIEPQIGVVPNDLLLAQIDAAGIEDPGLVEQLKQHVILAEQGPVPAMGLQAAPEAPLYDWE